MKIGIMQPYFLPYIGYWQLISIVDKYVIYDDVNFIKGGWINRNRILLENEPHYFNIRLIGAGAFKKINEIFVNTDERVINKSLRMIEAAYRKAPFYSIIYPLIEKILQCKENNLASFVGYSIKTICSYLDVKTEIIYSSSLDKDCNLKGETKVINICKLLEGTEYYNAIGGEKLYSFEEFRDKNIKLYFVKTNRIVYKQFKNEFKENLSIVDILMFNSREKVQELLQEYTLITE